jgi:two-component system LytT family response regulator
MKALIIEDEIHACEVLDGMLERHCPQVEVISITHNVKTSVEKFKELKPQLIFLDIEISGGSGFDVLDQLAGYNFKVIFVTSYEHYALKAIKYSALDYIQKPLIAAELVAAVNKAQALPDDAKKNIVHFNENVGKDKIESIMLPTLHGFVKVDLVQLLKIEAKGAYTLFHLTNGKNIIVSKNIGHYEEILPEDQFCRVHHSHILNLSHVKGYEKGRGGIATLNDGSAVHISSRKKYRFLDRFLK